MIAFNRIVIVLAVLFSTASAFFWGSNQETNTPYPQYYYHQRVLQPGVPYTEPPVPSIPVHVPLQAQLTPATVHNVQLVPCLCPVSQDFAYDKIDKNVPEYIVNSQHKTQ